MKNSQILILLLIISLISCQTESEYDLAIENVQIFNSADLTVSKGKTILIRDGMIADIVDKSTEFLAEKIIDGKNRMAVPGFVDTHIHITDVIGDYDNAPEVLRKDSIKAYKAKIADIHLKYGTTTIADMGQPDKWINETIKWQESGSTTFPNYILTGSALISDEERQPYISHIELMSPNHAKEIVSSYYNKGLKSLKVYWRLREPEMNAIMEESSKLNLNVFAHIDNNVSSIDKALEAGIKNFEHASTISNDVFNFRQHGAKLNSTVQEYYPGINSYMIFALEKIQLVEDNLELRAERDRIINNLIQNDATLSTTIHLFGSFVQRTSFDSFIQDFYTDENPTLNQMQLARLNKAFDSYMAYIKSAYDHGLKLRIGTDCNNGGKAVLSEIMLLCESGIPIKNVLQIATLNGAESLKIDNEYGNIEVGKVADLILFKESPLENYKNILTEKTIIRKGEIFNR